MPWNDFEQQPGLDDDQEPRQDDWNTVLDRQLTSMLDRDPNKPIVDYLRKIAMSRSFKPGRGAEDTAWSEGYRAMAVELLSRGGKDG